MFRLIHVPLDGSLFAEHALPMAVSLAKRDGSALQVVRVQEELGMFYIDKPVTFVTALDQDLVDHIRRNLKDTVHRIAELTGLRATSAHLRGPIPESLARHASVSKADLFVTATRRRGPMARFLFGSVADSLVRQSPIPILIVRPTNQAADYTQPPMFRHVLVPLDGSHLSEQAIKPALSLGGSEQGECTLLRVIPDVLPAAEDAHSGRASGKVVSWHHQLSDLKRQREAEANNYLERLAERLRAQSLRVNTQVVAHDQPATAIIDTASSRGVDAIALATRGHGGLKRLVIGIVAEKVMRDADTPVLVCPPVAEPVGRSSTTGATAWSPARWTPDLSAGDSQAAEAV